MRNPAISFMLFTFLSIFRIAEMEEEIIEKQVALVYELLCQGELNLARLLRRKILEKCEKKHQVTESIPATTNPVHNMELNSR